MQTTQLKLTLPLPLHEFLASKSAKYGMTMASYVKHLIVADVKGLEVPVFKASDATEQAYTRAKQEEKKGKRKPISNVEDFFATL